MASRRNVETAATNLHGSISHCAFVSRARQPDTALDQISGVRGAAPPRSAASAN